MDERHLRRLARQEAYRAIAAMLALLAIAFLGVFGLFHRPLTEMASPSRSGEDAFLGEPRDAVAFVVILVTVTLVVGSGFAYALSRAPRAAQSTLPSVGNE